MIWIFTEGEGDRSQAIVLNLFYFNNSYCQLGCSPILNFEFSRIWLVVSSEFGIENSWKHLVLIIFPNYICRNIIISQHVKSLVICAPLHYMMEVILPVQLFKIWSDQGQTTKFHMYSTKTSQYKCPSR